MKYLLQYLFIFFYLADILEDEKATEITTTMIMEALEAILDHLIHIQVPLPPSVIGDMITDRTLEDLAGRAEVMPFFISS